MKCDNCKKQNGGRVRCKLCHRMICGDCWSSKHNSEYCERCEGEHARVNRLHYDRDCFACQSGLHSNAAQPIPEVKP
jgi:hypothetical protein